MINVTGGREWEHADGGEVERRVWAEWARAGSRGVGIDDLPGLLSRGSAFTAYF